MVDESKRRPPQFLRRVQNKPAIRRRSNLFVFLQLLLVASGLAVGGLAAWGVHHWVHTNQVFRLRNLALQSVPQHLMPTVHERLDPHRGANLLLADLGRIRRTLETVPQVERARVRRNLPDTVEISLVIRPVWGTLQGTDARVEVSADGVVLGPASDDSPGAAVRIGAPIRDAVGKDGKLRAEVPGAGRLRDAVAIRAWLGANDPAAFGPIDHYRLEPDGVVVVRADRPWEIAIGAAERLAAKAENLAALLRQEPPTEPSRIDLRYRDMVVVESLGSNEGPEE